MAAGEPHGLRPFGLEPQRMLRLQKMHIIVGQDTDSESTPFARRDAVDRQARQGAGLHRPLGARALLRADAVDRAGRLHAAQRRRADRGRGRARRATARPPGRSPARAIRRSSTARSGWPGCRRRWPTTAPRSRSPTTAGSSPPRSRHDRSTTPTARCCAHEPRLPVPGRRPTRTSLARSPMEALARRRGRPVRGPRRLERRGLLPGGVVRRVGLVVSTPRICSKLQLQGVSSTRRCRSGPRSGATAPGGAG